jgi:hypothetical protein
MAMLIAAQAAQRMMITFMDEYLKTGELWGLFHSNMNDKPPTRVQFEEPFENKAEFEEKVHANEEEFNFQRSNDNLKDEDVYNQVIFDFIAIFICVSAIM